MDEKDHEYDVESPAAYTSIEHSVILLEVYMCL